MRTAPTSAAGRVRILASGAAVTAVAGGLGGCLGFGEDTVEDARPNAIGNAATTTKPAAPNAAPRSSLARLVGQKFVVAFRDMTVPPPLLLRRLERGEVGGVILFTDNVPPAGVAGIRRVVKGLQDAARAGGNPRLMIMTDQEGGDVKRMPGPPRRSPRELGADSPEAARAAGVATGRSLRAMGIGVNLAPVADVPTDASSFLGTRAFGTASEPRTRAAVAFARGLQRAGVAATAKHYPGLGSSGRRNTDEMAVTIATSKARWNASGRAFCVTPTAARA